MRSIYSTGPATKEASELSVMNATSTILALVMVATLFFRLFRESPPAPNGPETVATELLASLAAGTSIAPRASSTILCPAPRRSTRRIIVGEPDVETPPRPGGPLGEYAPVTDTESELIAAIGAGDVAFRRAPPSGPTLLTYRARSPGRRTPISTSTP